MARATAKDATIPAAATGAVKGVVGQAIVRELRNHHGSMVTLERLHYAVYGTPKDGGPNLPSIQKMIHVLRKRGIPIVRVSGYAIL
jgi:hypothetical protein